MQKKISIQLPPADAADELLVRKYICQSVAIPIANLSGYSILKSSIDARGKLPKINLTVNAFINEPFKEFAPPQFDFRQVHQAKKRVIVVGSGPSGLFAALRLIELGIKPIIIERGRDVKARRRDLALLNKQGLLNPESNYCFGEGGAGTYSDGKLYTRSSKRGNIQRILELFILFGADKKIRYEAHPHIGTNKLPGIISAMRQLILDNGGEIAFETRLTGFNIDRDQITGITTSNGLTVQGDAVILATGHSARDIFHLLHQKKILIESKPFALGVRAEHPQSLIDRLQYHAPVRNPYLPPASYSAVQQVAGRGVFSFCMCPGGIIAPAATSNGELVVNGWSPSKRNNPFANSGIVAEVTANDLQPLSDFERICEVKKSVLQTPLAMMYFQQYVERKAFTAGGGHFVAPAQRLVDFCEGKFSATLPDCSYLPGIHSYSLSEVLPPFICSSLQQAFKSFGEKMKGYYTNDAVLVATESRTSSPIRIPRNQDTLQHPQIKNLYPCGEGAGYAGGIVSAAMDGEGVATQIGQLLAPA